MDIVFRTGLIGEDSWQHKQIWDRKGNNIEEQAQICRKYSVREMI